MEHWYKAIKERKIWNPEN